MKVTPIPSTRMDAEERNRVLQSLRTVHRAVLTFIDINPKLARPKFRKGLTLLANMLSREHSESETGRAITEIHTMHQRGFPVRAYTDPKVLRVTVHTARALLVDARRDLGCKRRGGNGVASINAALWMTGCTEEDIARTLCGRT